jgi:hypothetical protein
MKRPPRTRSRAGEDERLLEGVATGDTDSFYVGCIWLP